MSSQISMRAKQRTNQFHYYIILVLSFMLYAHSLFAWDIDFSRRNKYLQKQTENTSLPQKTIQVSVPQLLTTSEIIQSKEPKQDIVILNTDKGFIPQSFAVRTGVKYNIHVVNINETEKNVSFILNSFNQHHGTYYGVVKSFELIPNLEGVYTFQCPETALEGKMVVLPGTQTDRSLASEK